MSARCPPRPPGRRLGGERRWLRVSRPATLRRPPWLRSPHVVDPSQQKIHARIVRIILTVYALWAVLIGCDPDLSGVHWPTDVLGGWLLAAAWLALSHVTAPLRQHTRSAAGGRRAAGGEVDSSRLVGVNHLGPALHARHPASRVERSSNSPDCSRWRGTGRSVLAGHGPAPRHRCGAAGRPETRSCWTSRSTVSTPKGVLWIRNLLTALAEEGRTVFVSSHLMSEMALVADHLIVVGRGRLLADTTVHDLIRRSRRRHRAGGHRRAGPAA